MTPRPSPSAEPAGDPETRRAPDPEPVPDPEPMPARDSQAGREPGPEQEPEPAAARDSRPEGASGPGVGPDSVSLFEPVTPPQPLAASEPADEPAASEETQFVDLTTVEPPEPEALSGAGGQGEGDATVVVITEPTLREGDDDAPAEDVPPPPESARPSADPAYADPAYADPAYADPAWVERGHPQPAYTPSSEGSSASGPASRAYEDLDPPAAPGTGGVPLLEELPGGWQAVRRRHLRQTITFLVALLGVLGLGTVAGLMYTGRVAWPFGGRVNVSTQLCTPTSPLPPKKIHVRVYNGSNRSGLARTVAGQLKALGFVVQETGNDPLEAKVTTAVEIRFGDGGELAGKTASAYFAGKIRQRRDDRTNDLVDVVLGPKLQAAQHPARDHQGAGRGPAHDAAVLPGGRDAAPDTDAHPEGEADAEGEADTEALNLSAGRSRAPHRCAGASASGTAGTTDPAPARRT